MRYEEAIANTDLVTIFVSEETVTQRNIRSRSPLNENTAG